MSPGRRGSGGLGQTGMVARRGGTPVQKADAHPDQPDSREHDDHSQEPPVADHPGSAVKRPEHPHALLTLGDVPCEMEHQPGRRPGHYGPAPTPGRRSGDEHGHREQRVRDRALALVSQQPEGQGVCGPHRWRPIR